MRDTKFFEVRDRATTMAMMGTAMDPLTANDHRDWLLLRKSGYHQTRCILFGSLEGGPFAYDPYDQPSGARTRQVAHDYIAKNWDTLKSGDIVDVQFILGETDKPKETDLE